MALIGKIRQNMWFVFALLGVALLAFMMMDSSGPAGGAGGETTAFSVNGEKIGVQDLQRIESFESSSSGLSGNALRSKVFDDLVTRSLVTGEGEDLGINVSEIEMEDLLFGAKMSPVVQQLFRDPRTGQIDPASIQQVRSNLDAGTANPQFVQLWNEKKKQVSALEIQNKISNMVSKGIYTPTWMAEELSKTNSISCNIDYVKVPFSAIADDAVSLTDADYNSFMQENKAQFNSKEEGRVVEYVSFDINPTVADSMAIKTIMEGKASLFSEKTPDQDSSFAIINGGNYINRYFKKDDVPESFRSYLDGMEVGSVVGPIVNERFYSALKLIDRKAVADSVELSHIFRRVDQSDIQGRILATNLLDSLQDDIENRVATWDSIAYKHSNDDSNKFNGGELGMITQGQFFPSINDVAFFSGKVGSIYRVSTQNGIHLIKVTDRVFNDSDPKYKVAFVNEGIEPSVATIEAITNRASEFITNNRSIENMRANLAEFPEARVSTSKVLNKKDYEFGEHGYSDDARNIILWAFKESTDLGDVSPDMFSFRDQQFNYEKSIVIPALQAKTSKGMAKLADVKSSIEGQVREYAKGKKIAEMMQSKSLEDIAASMTGATSGNVVGARTSSSFIQDIGYEPKVVAALISASEGSTTQSILGTGGVYKVTINSKTTVGSSNSVFAKQSENVKSRQNVNYQLFEALKNGAKVSDKRMDFGM